MRAAGVLGAAAVIAAALLALACGDDGGPGGDGGGGGDAAPAVPGPVAWRLSGALEAPHNSPPVALLPSAQVVVVGGSVSSGGRLNVTERYDPLAEVWTVIDRRTPGPPAHAVTVLLDSGQVLAAGAGESVDAPDLIPSAFIWPDAVLYDEVDGARATADLLVRRSFHAGAKLPSGLVLVAGGATADVVPGGTLAVTPTAELYDPAVESWTATGSLATARYQHTATLLPGGEVLVAGGRDVVGAHFASAELYDPATGTWRGTGAMNTARAAHVAILLGSGRVLVAGGHTAATREVTASAELYDPATGTWREVAPLPLAAVHAGACALPSGDALVTGGYGEAFRDALGQAVVFLDTEETWVSMEDLQRPRYTHAAILLADRSVLLVGGLSEMGSRLESERSDGVFEE